MLRPGERLRVSLQQQDDLLRRLIRQRTKDDGIDRAENQTVRADADPQREHDDKRKARLLYEHPHAISQVLKQVVLQSSGLQPERVPERACAAPAEIKLVAPIEPIP